MYAIAFAEFSLGSIKSVDARSYAARRWAQYRELDPIVVAQRDWLAWSAKSILAAA